MTPKERNYIKGLRIHFILKRLEREKIMDKKKFLNLCLFYGYHISTSRTILYTLVKYGVIYYDKSKQTIMVNEEYDLMKNVI